jgi:hypothetical protein
MNYDFYFGPDYSSSSDITVTIASTVSMKHVSGTATITANDNVAGHAVVDVRLTGA